MELDRALVKSQAKQLIKNRVVLLFIITMVASLLMGGLSGFLNAYYGPNDESINEYYDKGDNPIDKFGSDLFDENYFNNIPGVVTLASSSNSEAKTIPSYVLNTLTILSIFLMSLNVGVAYIYLNITRNKFDGFSKEFSNLFKVSFDRYYWQKLGGMLLKVLRIWLFSLLFIIPGIVEAYKLYFVEFIMADKPGISPNQAIKISKKMTEYHKGELFKMDLSFIAWYILVSLTFGIAAIYVGPYVGTVRALYYQNFKIRCLQSNVISEFDFMTNEERANYYRNQNYNSQQAYNSNMNNYNTYNQNISYNPNNGYNTNNSYNPNYNNSQVNYYQPSQINNNQYYNPNQDINKNSANIYNNASNSASINNGPYTSENPMNLDFEIELYDDDIESTQNESNNDLNQ